jgi:membrane protease YdiL (CAAX protease family)
VSSSRTHTGLVVALLPAAIAFGEVVRGTRSTGPWHPLGVIGFVWMLGAAVWYCWVGLKTGGTGAPACGNSSNAEQSAVGEGLAASRSDEDSNVSTASTAGGDKLRSYSEFQRPGDFATGGGARATNHATAASLFAISLFMLLSLGVNEVLFALLLGGWGMPFKLAVDGDALFYGLDISLWIFAFLILVNFAKGFDFHLRFNFKLADIGIFAVFAAVTFFVLRLYLQTLGGEHPPMHIFGVSKESGVVLFYTIGAIFTFINALCEELWFRGLLLGALRGLLRPWPAILLQALCFGLSHWMGTPQGILGLVLAGTWGIALGWWAYTRGSIWQALAVHLLADWLIFAYTNG